ncbi:hypothetical protein NJR55_04375 [Idiomarina sp. M1R2S28]|uniref:DUF3718 domain-containing protein n=1 Tax=Idiomarina rhizosphaerae TaxID=2961572 RepID=A0A9X2JSI7_9GAMM|nr:hypothetical protein [Idiomarina rhizosphaerae]MCP1338820.1 hypothetical protein [Idiomarina rhizosphaerae]
MQSTTSSFTMRTLLFTGFLSITVASPLSLAKDIDTENKSCSYSETEMLELSPREFDQNFEKGWPVLVENGDCLDVAADLIHTYYTENEVSSGALKTLIWHEGQLRAEVGQYQQAISLMEQTKKPPQRDIAG